MSDSTDGKKDSAATAGKKDGPKKNSSADTKDTKNAADILCQRCDSIILKAGSATRVKKEVLLHALTWRALNIKTLIIYV